MDVITLTNRNGLQARVASIGGALLSLTAPDRNGAPADIVLGLDDPEEYRRDRRYLGVIVGRYANRIGGARFTLDGAEHRLAANEGRNQLHGGVGGFSQCSGIWRGSRRKTDPASSCGARLLRARKDFQAPSPCARAIN
jgi:aldose 1-epimerase